MNHKDKLRVGNVVVGPGEKVYSWLDIAQDFAGPIKLPMLAVNGKQPGLYLHIISGVFGDEYTAMEAIYEPFRNINPDDGADCCHTHGEYSRFYLRNKFTFRQALITGTSVNRGTDCHPS